jgi:hypothetical protein
MSIIVRCECGADFDMPDYARGSHVRCKVCRIVFTVPAAEEPPPVVADPIAIPAEPPRPAPPPVPIDEDIRLLPIDEADPPQTLPEAGPAVAEAIPLSLDEAELPQTTPAADPAWADYAVRTVAPRKAEPAALPVARLVERPPRPIRSPSRFADDSDDRPASRRRARRAPAVPGKVWLLVGLGALLFVGVGYGLYSLVFSGSSAESELVGEWETDPEAIKDNPVGFTFLVKMTFNKDHTYQLNFVIDTEGRWEVVRRDGDTLHVKLTAKVLGMDQSDPPTAGIRVRDKDHIDIDADERSLQMHVKFRRVGTGPPMPKTLGDAEQSKRPDTAR